MLNSYKRSAQLLLLVLLAAGARGQTKANDLSVNYSIPDAPAFNLLNLNPDKVEHPATPRDFATSILNGFDENGNFQSGIAIDVNPYMSWYGKTLNIDQYKSSTWRRRFANSKISIGTAKGTTSSDPSSKLAFGLHVLLWNRNDSRMSTHLQQSFDDATGKAFIDVSCPPMAAGSPAVAECQLKREDAIEKGFAPARKAWEAAHWNGSYWAVATGMAVNSTTGSLVSLTWNGAGAWTTVAYGFEELSDASFWRKHAQLALHFEWRNNETVTDPSTGQNGQAAQTFVRDSELGGLRWILGSASSNGSFETAFRHSHPKDPTRKNEDYARLTVALEHKISDSLWLNISAGSDANRGPGKDKFVVSTNFKWATSSSAKIKP